MSLPQCTEDRFFEATTRASEIRSALSADKDELAGNDFCQFVDLENAKGGVVAGHGGVC